MPFSNKCSISISTVELDISNNLWTEGPIPGEAFEGLALLNYVDMGDKNLTTALPSEFVTLPELQFLYMDGMLFKDGAIMSLDVVSQMVKIFEFWLDYTPITGGIPASIGDATTLASFSAPYSGLTGPIPPEMGNLQLLDRLWLYQNSLTGDIPVEFGQFSRLMILYLEGNELQGSMPSEVCALSLVSDLGADCDGDNPMVECACCTCCGGQECGDFD